jgi:hypothetical protein
VGAARAEGFVGMPPHTGTHTYAAPGGTPPLNGFALGGTWRIADQPATAVAGATLTATVRSRFVYLVLSPPPGGRAGAVDVMVDGERGKHVVVDQQRLYTLADFGRTSQHTLHLDFAPGTSAYAFTFG